MGLLFPARSMPVKSKKKEADSGCLTIPNTGEQAGLLSMSPYLPWSLALPADPPWGWVYGWESAACTDP